MSENSDSPSTIFSNEAKQVIAKLERDVEESRQLAKDAYQKAKAEIEAKIESQKEQITAEIRAELLQQLKDEKAKLDQSTKELNEIIKQKIIKKILKLQPEANKTALEQMSLNTLKMYYLGVVKVELAENHKRFSVTCPDKNCKKYLGTTTTKDDAVKIFNLHRKKEHRNTGAMLGKLILLSAVLSILGFAVASRQKKKRAD